MGVAYPFWTELLTPAAESAFVKQAVLTDRRPHTKQAISFEYVCRTLLLPPTNVTIKGAASSRHAL